MSYVVQHTSLIGHTMSLIFFFFFFSSRRRHTRLQGDWSSDVCSSDLDRCPATALLETGSPDGWIPYYCEVTHRRAALLEDAIGDTQKAARYLAHAERVKTGWVPDGAILPRATGLPAGGAGCASGGACAASGCGRAAAVQTQPD